MRLIVLFVFFSFLQALSAQVKLDSVQVEGKWMYVYPEKEPILWINRYYDRFELDKDQYAIWLEWKINSDARADLETAPLYLAIQKELKARFLDKHDTISEYWIKHEISSHKRRGLEFSLFDQSINEHALHFSRYTNQFSIWYESKLSPYPIPVLQTLPDGWYVNYFEPIPEFKKREEVASIDSTRIARVFYLKNNKLDGELKVYDVDGTILSTILFKDGFKNGPFQISTTYERFISKRNDEVIKKKHFYKIGGYENDTYQGKISYFENGELKREEHYVNQQRSGIWLSVNESDSSVFHAQDPNCYCDSIDFYMEEYPSLPNNQIIYFKKQGYNVLSDSEYSGINRFELKQNLLLSNCKESFPSWENQNRKSYLNVPTFKDTFYVYFRFSEQLKAKRWYDSPRRLTLGESYYSNGNLMDKYWLVGDERHFAFFDLSGIKIYEIIETDSINQTIRKKMIFDRKGNLIENEINPVIIIDGFKSVEWKEGIGNSGFVMVENQKKNDMNYQQQFWDKHKNLVFVAYSEGKSNSVELYLKNGENVKLVRSANGIELIMSNNDWLWFRKFDSLENLVSSTIHYRNQPFAGKVSYKVYKRWGLKGNERKLNIGYEFNPKWVNDLPLNRFYGEFDVIKRDEFWNERIPVFPETQILRKYAPMLKTQYVDGKIKGKVKACDWNGKPYIMQVDQHGLTGTVKIYRKESEILRMTYSNWVNKKLDRPWNRMGYFLFNLPYLEKEIPFLDGQVDGTVIRWTPKKDTLFSANFSKNKPSGRFQQTSGEFGSLGYFEDDQLKNELVVFHARSQKERDTVLNFHFTKDGTLVDGETRQLCQECLDHFLPDEDQPTFIEGEFHSNSNGNVIADFVAGPQNIHLELDEKGVVLVDYFWNGSKGYRLKYPDSIAKNRIFGLQALNWLYRFHLDPFSESELISYKNDFRVSSGFLYSDVSGVEGTYMEVFKSEPHFFLKYAPNGQVIREGVFNYEEGDTYRRKLVKTGIWRFYSYDGQPIHSIQYVDTLFSINTKNWFGKGIQHVMDSTGNIISKRLLLNEVESLDCSQDEYYARREFITLEDYTPDQRFTASWLIERYDNGAKMAEGLVRDGKPEGLWKYYSPNGTLSEIGNYENGIRHGNWLIGDLSDKAYFGETCLDPNQSDIEFVIGKLERQKEIEFKVYNQGVVTISKSYDFFGK